MKMDIKATAQKYKSAFRQTLVTEHRNRNSSHLLQFLLNQNNQLMLRSRHNYCNLEEMETCDVILREFPSEWPSRCPADITTEMDVLSQRCLDLTHCFHAEQSRSTDSDSVTSHEREYESLRMLEGLERMTAELLACADQRKKEWERWDMRSSGALCPIRRRGEWGDPDRSCLPPILSYISEAELRELESQRLRVEQLQQAIRLQKAMSDNLVSFLDSHSGAERPSAVVLRGLYSLLAEGGVQFPSLVLDSE